RRRQFRMFGQCSRKIEPVEYAQIHGFPDLARWLNQPRHPHANPLDGKVKFCCPMYKLVDFGKEFTKECILPTVDIGEQSATFDDGAISRDECKPQVGATDIDTDYGTSRAWRRNRPGWSIH